MYSTYFVSHIDVFFIIYEKAHTKDSIQSFTHSKKKHNIYTIFKNVSDVSVRRICRALIVYSKTRGSIFPLKISYIWKKNHTTQHTPPWEIFYVFHGT